MIVRLYSLQVPMLPIILFIFVARHTIVGPALRHGSTIGCCTPSSLEISGVSLDIDVMFELFFVLGVPIHAFQQQPSLLQSHNQRTRWLD